ncbi:unnamed protein product, partial [Timema podura]|nr:unnamed protein product [Timema podura]
SERHPGQRDGVQAGHVCGGQPGGRVREEPVQGRLPSHVPVPLGDRGVQRVRGVPGTQQAVRGWGILFEPGRQ